MENGEIARENKKDKTGSTDCYIPVEPVFGLQNIGLVLHLRNEDAVVITTIFAAPAPCIYL